MNLKDLARARGTNLRKIAEECDVPASTLYAISSGDTNPDNVGISLFMKVANALDMSVEELYSIESYDYALVSFENAESEKARERELVEQFRLLDDKSKNAVEALISSLAGDKS